MRSFLRQVLRAKGGATGFALVAVILLLALFGTLRSVDPNKIDVISRLWRCMALDRASWC